jgi:hypothetical protein
MTLTIDAALDYPELVFVNLLRSPGTDSQPICRTGTRICKRLWSPGIDSDGPIPPAYAHWRAGTTIRVVVQARHAGNRFLGSLKGLQIRAPAR